jgi:hypothetical protein
MMKWKEQLNGECPKRDAHSMHERCDLFGVSFLGAPEPGSPLGKIREFLSLPNCAVEVLIHAWWHGLVVLISNVFAYHLRYLEDKDQQADAGHAEDRSRQVRLRGASLGSTCPVSVGILDPARLRRVGLEPGSSLAWCCLRRLRLFNFRPAQVKECPHDNGDHWPFSAGRIGSGICLDLAHKKCIR